MTLKFSGLHRVYARNLFAYLVAFVASLTIAASGFAEPPPGKGGGNGGGGGGDGDGGSVTLPTYNMTILGTLGGDWSHVHGTNSFGDMVGASETTHHPEKDYGDSHAFIYIADADAMSDLNDLIPADSNWILTEAFDINDLGQITGAGLLNGEGRAFRLTPTNTDWIVEDLAPRNASLDGPHFSPARGGINYDGDVIVWTGNILLCTDEEGLVDLGGGEPFGINNRTGPEVSDAQIAAGRSNSDGEHHPHRYTPGIGWEDLGVIKEPGGSGESFGKAFAINDSGQVVGFADAGTSKTHAFRFTDNVGMEDLGVLGGNSSYANAINNVGDVVGQSDTGRKTPAAGFIYTDETGMVNLEGLIVNLPADAGTVRPQAINDSGQIAVNVDGYGAALLTPDK